MSAYHSKGTTLKYGTYSVGQLTEISGVQLARETIEVTTLTSTDGFKEYIGGLADGGEVAFTGHYDPKDTGQVQALLALTTGSVGSWSIVFPTALSATWAFDGILTAYNVTAPLGDKLGFEGSIKVSGKPTLTV